MSLDFEADPEGRPEYLALARRAEAEFQELMRAALRLKGEGKIPLGGLGAVKLVDRKARIGRNPATGEQIKIPAKTVVKLTPAKALKDLFNKKAKK